jgi:hypothetical protein
MIIINILISLKALDVTTTRLLKETRAIMRELEDVRYLDDLIALLNNDVGPVIHKEWPYELSIDTPIEEGVVVT